MKNMGKRRLARKNKADKPRTDDYASQIRIAASRHRWSIVRDKEAPTLSIYMILQYRISRARACDYHTLMIRVSNHRSFQSDDAGYFTVKNDADLDRVLSIMRAVDNKNREICGLCRVK